MEKISEMIERFCPDAVDWVELEKLCRTVTPPLKLKTNQYFEEGQYMIIDQGQNFCAGYTDVEEALLPEGEYILYGDHTCSVKYIDKRFAQGADGLKILKAIDSCVPKYLYYALLTYNLQNTEYKRHWTQAKEILIPLPSLAIQHEIVKALDSFTSLITNLETEFDARQKQYEHYRKTLLSIEIGSQDIEQKCLAELSTISRGKRVVRRDLMETGTIPVYQNSLKPLGYSQNSNYPANTTFVISAGAAGEVGYSDVDYWGADDCFSIICESSLDSKYAYYWLKTKEDFLKSRIRGGAIKRLSRDEVENLKIEVPSLDKQKKIVISLDTFESLITNIKRELDARKKQYEYYREKLLTF